MTTRRHAAARTGGRHPVMPAVAALLMLGGCASQYTAVPPSAFPPPLMEALQMTVNLEMDEAFRNYTHTETMTDLRAATWTMPIGPASVDWMTSLVGSRFTSIDGGNKAALKITPEIERVEFSLPTQTGTEFYEAWIQYRVRITNVGGKTVADLPLAAYGKSREGLMVGAETGMADALNQAMRDATAALAIELKDNSKVFGWTRSGAAAGDS